MSTVGNIAVGTVNGINSISTTGTVDLNAAAAISANAAISPTNLYMTAGSTIGSSASRIQTNASGLYASSGGNQFITDTNSSGVSVAAKTTANNGNIDILTTAGALSVGTVNGLSGISANGAGTIGLTSNTGNINLAANLTTGNTTSSAITLNAGSTASAGTSTGGNIIISGTPTITTGTGGRTTLYTGSISGSTGLTALVGSGTGHFRYNSDESATNYTAALGSGIYAIYREAPSVTLQGNLTKTYDAQNVTSTGLLASVGSVTATGGTTLANGDTGNVAAADAMFLFGGATQQTNYQSGGYTITGSQTTSALGYNVTYASGALTINKANLTKVTASKTYDGLSTVMAAQMTAVLGVNGESFTASAGTASISDKNVATANNTLTNLSGLTLSSSNGGLASNYNLSSNLPAAGVNTNSVTINKADLTLSGSRVYDGTNSFAGQYLTATGVNGETFAVTGLGDATNLASKNVQSNQALASVTGLNLGSSSNGGLSTNYNALATSGSSVSVTVANLTVTANQVTKTYDGGVGASGNATIGTLAGAAAGDSVNHAGVQEFTNKDAGTNNKTVKASGVTIKDAGNVDVTGNYNINYVDNTTSTINQADLTIKANNDARFVTLSDVNGYNGVTYSGFVGGEDSTALTGSLAINRTNASTDVGAGTYSGKLVASGLSSNNYNIHYQNGDYTIIAANQLLIRTSNEVMTYGDNLPAYSTTAQYLDGSNNQIATLTRTINGNRYVFSDTAGGGTISIALNPYSGSSIASNSSSSHVVVGNYAIKDANPSISGNLNFVNSPVFVGALTVNTKAVTPSATNVSKVYDGTTSMANVSVGLSGKVTGDSLSISGTGAFSQKNVGSNLGYTISGVTLSGNDASNYHLIGGTNSFSGSDGAITAATLKITTSDVIKTYDRTTQAAGSAIVTDGTQLFGSDSLSGGSFVFSDWNAGVGNKLVNVSSVTVNDGNGGNNYAVSYVNNTTSTINAKNLTASFSANSKTYDGNRTAIVTGSSSDVITGDVVTFANTSATFSIKDVYVGNTVTVSGISLGGADAGNYALQNTTATTSANISKKDVTLSSIAAVSRAYDGTNAATISSGAIATGVTGETLAISGTGTFSDKNAANGKTVTVADVTTLSKANGTGDWSNYNLTTTGSITTLADITQAALSLTSTDVTKTYDGTLTALGTVRIVSGTLFAGDSLTGGSFAFTDKNFGVSNKVVTVSGVTVGDGINNGNYRVSYVNNTSSTINRATLSAGLTGTVEKIYDGLTSANNLSNSNFSITGWAGTEGATVNQTLGSYSSANVSDNGGVGNVSAVLASSNFVANTGTDLNNYHLPNLATGYVGKITPASLTVKVNDTVAFVTQDPNTAVDNGLSYTGFKNGETAATALGTIGTRVYTGVSNPVAGSYADVYELSATPTANHGNYTVSVTKGALTVTPADKLLINIASQSATYGALNASNAGASASTVTAQYCLVAGNCTGSNIVDLTMANLGNGVWQATDSTNTSVTFSTLIDSTGHLSAGGFLNVGNYTYGATTTTPPTTSNFTGQVVNGGVLTVQAKALTLSANNVTKVYDGNTNIGLTRLDTDKMVGDDVIANANNGVFDSKNAGSRQVTLNGISLSGADQNNYSISTAPLAGSGSISAKAVTLTAPSITKSYDGLLTYSTSANDLNALSAQLVVGDSVTNATLAYTDKNAGFNKSVTLDSYAINDGNSGRNYSISRAGNSVSTITKANATVTANSVLNKVYNGSNQTVTGFTATGLVHGDVLNGVTASGTGKNAGTYIVRASGSDGNYNLTFVDGTLMINQAILQLQANGVTKTYDGTTTLAGVALTPSGVFFNDQVAAVANTGNFVSKDVGNSIGFTLSGLTLSGSSASNYQLQTQTLLGNGAITPKRLNLIGSFANNKVFDGNVLTSIVPGVLTGLVGQETLDLSVSGAFFNPAVGANKAVMARYSLKNGHHGGLVSNYVLDDEILNASITSFPQVINPVPVNPGYKTPERVQLVNEKVAITGNTQAVTEKVMVSEQNQQSAMRDQQACVKDFSAECGSGQESLAGKLQFTHHYDTFY